MGPTLFRHQSSVCSIAPCGGMSSSSGVMDEAAPTKLSAEDDVAESNDASVGGRVIELAVEVRKRERMTISLRWLALIDL